MTPHRVTYRATAEGHDTLLCVRWQTRDQAERHAAQLRELPNVSRVVVEPEMVAVICEMMGGGM